MEAYSSFAQVYDLFMDNVPYEEWSRYLISLLKEYQVTDGTVVELRLWYWKNDKGFWQMQAMIWWEWTILPKC